VDHKGYKQSSQGTASAYPVLLGIILHQGGVGIQVPKPETPYTFRVFSLLWLAMN